MIVTLNRAYGSLFSGERASFSDDEARGLIDRGIAAPITKPISGVTKDVPVPAATGTDAADTDKGDAADKPSDSKKPEDKKAK